MQVLRQKPETLQLAFAVEAAPKVGLHRLTDGDIGFIVDIRADLLADGFTLPAQLVIVAGR
jgi:hypothetical protein